MDYEAVTDVTSQQHRLKSLVRKKDQDGIFIFQGRKLVAIGLKGASVGDYGVIRLSSGQTIEFIVGDIKHEGCNSADGSQLEFIVDTNAISRDIERAGDFNDIYPGTLKEVLLKGNVFDGN